MFLLCERSDLFFFLRNNRNAENLENQASFPGPFVGLNMYQSKEDPNSSTQSATKQSPTSCFWKNCTHKLAVFCQETLTAYTSIYTYCKHKGSHRLFNRKNISTGQCLWQLNSQHFFPILSQVTCYLYALG